MKPRKRSQPPSTATMVNQDHLDQDTGARPNTEDEAHAVFDSFDIDMVVKVLRKTMFSPFFCAFIPLSVVSLVKDKEHPAVLWSAGWAAALVVIHSLNHLDRIYANQASFLFAPTKLKWEDQIVLITGGGSGVGALLAETLAMRNVSVVVLDRAEPKYETVHENIYTYKCDISQLSEVESVAEKIRDEVGAPTIIVNNAGVVKGKLLLDLEEDDVKDTFGANVISHFWVLKAFLPDMIRSGAGHVVSVSSVLGVLGVAQATAYCATKAAVISLHSSLRFELDNRYLAPAIRTTLVLPAFIQTNLFASIQFPKSRLWQWLAPPVAPHTVVKAIIEALDANESRVIRLAFYTHVARFMNFQWGFAPRWLIDLTQWTSNADHSMRAYGPHPDAAERLLAERNSTRRGR